jgi:hypothetical protein
MELILTRKNQSAREKALYSCYSTQMGWSCIEYGRLTFDPGYDQRKFRNYSVSFETYVQD